MAVFYKYQYTNKRKNIHPWANESEMVFIDRVKVKCGLIIIDNPSRDPGHSDYLVKPKEI